MRYNTETIGKIIEKERKKRKWSQEKLGEKVGIVGKQISNYEKGKTTPPIDVLFELCDIFECELGYLLGENDYSQGTKVKTIVTNETGLSVEAVNAITKITGTGSPQTNNSYYSKKRRQILNTLFTSQKFYELIQAIFDLDETYAQKDNTKDLWQRLEDELGKELLDTAMKYHDITTRDAETDTLTDEECEAIKEFNETVDKCHEFSESFKREMVFKRFVIQETMTLLINELYPTSDK